jgi:hypothetical protein
MKGQSYMKFAKLHTSMVKFIGFDFYAIFVDISRRSTIVVGS